MTTCADVFVRPQTCDVISIYPSQLHPYPPPPGRRANGPVTRRYKLPQLFDEDVEIALALLELLENDNA